MKPKSRPNFKRIGSIAPAIAEILITLELSDCMVGVTDSCDYPDSVREIPDVSLWRLLKAGKSGRLYQYDCGSTYRKGPRILEMAELLSVLP